MSPSSFIQTWLESTDPATQKQILSWKKNNPKILQEAFSGNLSFGTGGIRALMGAGTNRLNLYTVRRISQGLATYLLKKPSTKRELRVVIGYDNRENSQTFAKEVAQVFASYQMEAFLFTEMRPTPMISFACLYFHARLAIMITASHNPPEYNGYKVYGEDGGQVISPQDQEIMAEIKKTPFRYSSFSFDASWIHKITSSFDEIYLQTLKSVSLKPSENEKEGHQLKIVYTGLQGAGSKITPKALKAWGFSSLFLVKEQCRPDPFFTYAKNPNPESKQAFELGSFLLQKEKGDLLLANDPDADRVGVVVSHHQDFLLFSGNQIASLLLYHIFSHSTSLPENSIFIKTIVTTELFNKICNFYQKPCVEVLTGFKYIAAKIHEWELSQEHTFIFGAEESLGYLMKTFLRDKDGVLASCLIAEMALWAKQQKKTLYDLLLHLYQTFGVFRDKQLSISFPLGREGQKKMSSCMEALRQNKLFSLGSPLMIWEDYQSGVKTYFPDKKQSPLELPTNPTLRCFLQDGTKIVIRPSGTEPKIKIYVEVKQESSSPILEVIHSCDQKLDKILSSLKAILT